MDSKPTKPKNKIEASDKAVQGITQSMLEHVGGVAKSCGATAVFVYADALKGEPVSFLAVPEARVYYVTKEVSPEKVENESMVQFLRVPNVPMTRIGQVKITAFLALSKGLVARGDRVCFVTGVEASGNLDTIIVTEVGREFELLSTLEDSSPIPVNIKPAVIERVVDLASEIGKEGREGKQVGTIFVVGDSERVLPLTRQLILNPFKGYPATQRNILDHSFEETLKEMATLDGAFIIRGNGVVESCGTYLKTASQEEFELPRGLGARHQAAAAITAVTDTIAVTVSQSTGTVTIFRGGGIITEIQKPRSAGPLSKPGSA